MTDYDNTNSGALFKNEKKQRENQPDRTGQACVECPDCGTKTDFWVSGWIKKSRKGDQYMSIAFTAKEDKPVTPATDDFDDDIPF